MDAASRNILREVRMFEFYSDRIWPLHRKFLKSNLSKRCTKCILSERYAPLTQGLCPLCLQGVSTEKTTPSAKSTMEEMNEVFKRISKNEIPFHALILFSGGKDSTLLISTLRKKFPNLRMLALTVDSTFMSPVAMENSRQLVARLNVPHVIFRAPPHTMEKIYRNAFMKLKHLGTSQSVDQFDGDFMMDIGRNFAANYSIPLLVAGLSKTQCENILRLQSYESTGAVEQTNRESIAGLKLSEFLEPSECQLFWNGASRNPESRPRVLFPFFEWNFSEEEILNQLESEGLLLHRNLSPLVTNNQLIPLMGLVDVVRFGYSSFEPEFAKNVRAGKSSREQWLNRFQLLEYSAKTGSFISSALDEVLKRLSLSREDLGIPR